MIVGNGMGTTSIGNKKKIVEFDSNMFFVGEGSIGNKKKGVVEFDSNMFLVGGMEIWAAMGKNMNYFNIPYRTFQKVLEEDLGLERDKRIVDHYKDISRPAIPANFKISIPKTFSAQQAEALVYAAIATNFNKPTNDIHVERFSFATIIMISIVFFENLREYLAVAPRTCDHYYC